MKTHELKCWEEFFEEIIAGRKTHDLRRSTDRDFQIGDEITLRETNKETGGYTGREAQAKITYITSSDSPCAYSSAALQEGFCILSITLIT